MNTYTLFQKHQWVDRLLLIFARDLATEDLKTQWSYRQNDLPGYRDRNLKVYLILGENILNEAREEVSESGAPQVRQRFKINPDEFAIILLDKDGTEKLRKFFPTPSPVIFKTIDATPMRQREIEGR